MRLGFEIDVDSVDLIETPVEALSRELRRAFETEPLVLREKAAAAVAAAHGRFTWEHAGQRIEEYLGQILEAGSPGPA